MSNRELPMMPFYPNEFDASTKGWPWEARGAYLLLLAAQWQLGALPVQEFAMRRLLSCDSRQWRRIAPFVMPKFKPCEDGARNFRLEQHRLEALRLKEAKRSGAKYTNAKRWPSESHSDTDSDRSASRTAVASDSQIHGFTDSLEEETLPNPSRAEPRKGRRAYGTNPREEGTNPRANGSNPRALGTNPRAERNQSRREWRGLIRKVDYVRSTAPLPSPERLTWAYVQEHVEAVTWQALETIGGCRVIADRDRFTTGDLEARFREAYETLLEAETH